MSGLLLALLIAEAIVIFIFNGKNLISPSFISCCVFIFSTILFILGKKYFAHDLSFKTVVVIVIAIMCIFVGEAFINSTTKDRQFIKLNQKGTTVVLPHYACYILEAFVLVIGVLYFKSVYKYSLKVGNTSGNYFGMAEFVRNTGGYKKGLFLSQTTVLSECILFYFTYSFFYNKALTGKYFFRYFWIFPAFAIHIIANDNRIALLRIIVVFVITMFFVAKQSSGWSKKYDKRILFFTAFFLALYILLFRLLGYRTGTSENKSPFQNIVQYCSSGLFGLDEFLNGRIIAENSVFAQKTLASIYEILRSWGFSEIPDVSGFEEFFFYGTANTNVYTGIKSLIQDFTFAGMIFVLIAMGMLVSWLMNSLRYNKFGLIKLTLLGYVMYPCIMLSIDWTASSVLQTTTLYVILYLLVINYCAGIFREKKYDRLVDREIV